MGFRTSLNGRTHAKATTMVTGQGGIFGRDIPKILPSEFFVYQDEILAITTGTKADHKIDEGLPLILEQKYGKS